MALEAAPKILGFDEEVEDSLQQLDDGLYTFTYGGFVQGNHAPDNYDPQTYPTVIVTLQMENYFTHETHELKETFKMLDTAYNKSRIFRFFNALGAPKNPTTGKVRMAWQSAIGHKGMVELETREIQSRNSNETRNWQDKNFVAPENQADKINKWNEKMASQPQTLQMPEQPQPAPATQTTPQPAATSSWSNGSW